MKTYRAGIGFLIGCVSMFTATVSWNPYRLTIVALLAALACAALDLEEEVISK